MTDTKITNCLLLALVVISSVMFIWTVNYISAQTANPQIPTAISAFNA